MNTLIDIKYALRMLLNKPKFTALAVIIMAMGLGLSVYMLTFLSNAIYKDLPVKNGSEIYSIETVVGKDDNTQRGEVSLLDYVEIKESSRSFSDIGAYRTTTTVISDGESSRRKEGAFVTSNIFEFFDLKAQLGRIFNNEDLKLGAAPVTVISHNLWVDYFLKDDAVLGKTVKIDGIATEIIGVMAPVKIFPERAELWLPARDNVLRLKRDSTQRMVVYVKKYPEVSEKQANMDLAAIFKRLANQYPETNADLTGRLITIQATRFGNSFIILQSMFYSALLVLALACINVTNLLLVRANERAKETAIRMALGAPRSRLIMQIMWESLIICLAGGVIGLLGAAYGLEILNTILVNIFDGAMPFWWINSVDTTVVLLSMLLILITAFIAGVIPAWKMTQCNVNEELRDGTRGAVGKKTGRLNKSLVILEVALSCILLTIACVLFIMLEDTKNTDFGVNIENKIQARVKLPTEIYDTDSKKTQYFSRALAELKSISGVTAVGSMSTLPGNGTSLKKFQPEGYEVIKHKYPTAYQVASFGDSMETIGLPLIEGRHFNSQDKPNSLAVAMLTEGLAKKYWPDESAIGKRFKLISGKNKDKWLSVIGIVGNVTFDNGVGNRKLDGTIFQPYTQETRSYMSNFITVTKNSENKLTEITDSLARVDPLVPTYMVYFIAEEIRRGLGGLNFIRDLFSVFALCALLLAATGIYGVLANTTSRRTQELGIRRALGATDNNVMMLLVKQGWVQLLIGLFIGLPLGYMISLGFVSMFVPNTNSYYYAYVIVPLAISFVVLISTYIPAKKAIKLEPSSALRYE